MEKLIKEKEINELVIDSIKILGVQAVNKAKSGHPGIVLGAAPIIYALFIDHLIINPRQSDYFLRDRLTFSAGHGSALLYSVLHIAGFDISIDDLKNFRQLNSKTPGHLEYDLKIGVEATTGPLGQGLAMASGMSLAQSFLGSLFNYNNEELINYYTYVLCGDGDLQEGISFETLSFVGKYQLKKLIILYDSNDIQLDSEVKKVRNDNFKNLIESLNINYILVKEGDNWKKISYAINLAKKANKPTLIEIKTIIGYQSSNQGTIKVHGAPLLDDIDLVKKNMQWFYKDFFIPEKVYDFFRSRINKNFQEKEKNWKDLLNKYKIKDPLKSEKLINFLTKKEELLISEWETLYHNNKESTRVSSGRILSFLGKKYPYLLGGSADLSNSTKAIVSNEEFSENNYSGRHIFFGVREFAMAAIVNGINLISQNLIAFGSTFLIFSDYMKPALRLAALMKLKSTFIFTHDSIALGEDGPTHQPIEQLAMLRSIPNFILFRPADIKETIGSYMFMLKNIDSPIAFALTRQDLPQLKNSSSLLTLKGGYIIKTEEKEKELNLIIIATGSEVDLAIDVANLIQEKINTRVVSMPSIEIFEKENSSYQEEILPKNIKKAILELSSDNKWLKYVNDQNLIFNLNSFGMSGKEKDILDYFGFTKENIKDKIIKNFNF
jgi:transketolase